MCKCEDVFLNSISVCIIAQNLEGHSLHSSSGPPISSGPEASTDLCGNENIAECYLNTITYIGSLCINTITEWAWLGTSPSPGHQTAQNTHFFLPQCFIKHTHTWQQRRNWDMSKMLRYCLANHMEFVCVCVCYSGSRNVWCLFTKHSTCKEAKCLNSMCCSQFKSQSSVCLPDTSWACARSALVQQARSSARSDALAESRCFQEIRVADLHLRTVNAK